MGLRIIHVSAYFAPAFVYGGPPRSIFGLCRAQRDAGADVEVITTTANGAAELPAAVVNRGEYGGVPVSYCPRSWPKAIFQSRTLGDTLASRLRSADVVHIHGLWNATVWRARQEAARANVPWLLSPRGMLEPAALAHDAVRKRASYQLFDRRLITGASLLHATSPGEQDTLRKGWPDKRVVYVPNGVAGVPPARDAGRAIREKFALPRDAPLVLFLGRLHPMKRLDLLADAFAEVLAHRPDARLVVAGPDDGGRAPVAGAFDRLGGAVTWTACVDDETKSGLLDACTTLVLCSDSESFGMAAAEAMAAGRPVVVTRTCPWPDIEAHRTGHWVPQDAASMAAAVIALLDHPEDARAMGARGRALIGASYTWESAARRMIAEYEQAIGRAEACA